MQTPLTRTWVVLILAIGLSDLMGVVHEECFWDWIVSISDGSAVESLGAVEAKISPGSLTECPAQRGYQRGYANFCFSIYIKSIDVDWDGGTDSCS